MIKLVRMTLRMNKRLARLKKKERKKVFTINTQELKGIKERFEEKKMKSLRRR